MKAMREPQTATTTVQFDVQFSRGPQGKRRVRAVAEQTAAPTATPVPIPPSKAVTLPVPTPTVVPTPGPTAEQTTERVPPLTLRLVLGHHFERLVCEGVVKDYAEIARRTGLSRARVTQIVDLTLLAPEVQYEMLFSDSRPAFAESLLRKIVYDAAWEEQRVRVSNSGE